MSLYWVENWTKWRLYLGEGEDRVVVGPHQQVSIQYMVGLIFTFRYV